MAVLIETKANSASFLIEIVLITEIEAELSKSNYQASLAKIKNFQEDCRSTKTHLQAELGVPHSRI